MNTASVRSLSCVVLQESSRQIDNTEYKAYSCLQKYLLKREDIRDLHFVYDTKALR